MENKNCFSNAVEQKSSTCLPKGLNKKKTIVELPINVPIHRRSANRESNGILDNRKKESTNRKVEAILKSNATTVKPTNLGSANKYTQEELECGIILSQLSKKSHDNQPQDRIKRHSVGVQADFNALKQSLFTGGQSSLSQCKNIIPNKRQENVQPMPSTSSTSNSNSTYSYLSNNVGREVTIDGPVAKKKYTLSIKYQCSVCRKCLDHFIDYKHHMIVTHGYTNLHNTSANMRYMCTDCGKKMKTREKFHRHCQEHGDPDYECNTCLKVFATKYTLRNHLKIHSRKVPGEDSSRN